jgi:hypothetical protein
MGTMNRDSALRVIAYANTAEYALAKIAEHSGDDDKRAVEVNKLARGALVMVEDARRSAGRAARGEDPK